MTITDPAVLAAELAASGPTTTRSVCTKAIGYVTPNDEHEGRGDAIRAARHDGMRDADQQRRAWHRNHR